MKKQLCTALFLFLTLFAQDSLAQIRVDVQVMNTRYLSRLDELQALATSGQVLVNLSNTSGSTQRIKLDVTMSSSQTDFAIRSNPDALPSVIEIDAGVTKRLTTTEVGDLFYDDSFILHDGRLLMDFLRNDPTGQVPSGQYQLCIKALSDSQSQLISNQACANIVFQQFSAPLIQQINGQPCPEGGNLALLQDANAPFSIAFTPPSFSLNQVAATDFRYTVFMIELQAEDMRDPNQILQAMQGQARGEGGTFSVRKGITPSASGSAQIIGYLQSADFSKSMEPGRRYAVTVLAESNSVDFANMPNGGFSPVCTFTYGEVPGGVAIAMDPSDNDLPSDCLNGDCNNMPVATGGTDVGALAAGDVVRIGCFKIRITESTTAGTSSFDGRGYVKLPLLSAQFLVRLEGLIVKTINGKLVAVGGKAIGLHDTTVPATGPIADLYAAFQGVRDDVTSEVSASLPAVVSDFVNGQVASGSKPIDNIFDEAFTVDRVYQQLTNAEFQSGLPIGYSSEVDGQLLRIGIFGLTFTPSKATMQVILQTPVISGLNQALYFGGNNICISPKGIFATQATFYLGQDLSFGIGAHTLKLNGNGSAPGTDLKTFITLDNGNFKEIKFAGEWQFDRELFVPKTGTGAVSATFQSEAKDNFSDFIFSFNVATPFTLKDHQNWEFTLNSVALDLSSARNPAGWAAAPEDMRTSAGSNETEQNTWTGIFVKTARIKLPPDFKLANGQSPSVNIDFLMIGFNSAGVSFDANAVNLLTLAPGAKAGLLSGFKFSIDLFNAKMRASEFSELSFNGKLRFPLFDQTPTSDGAFPYHVDLLSEMPDTDEITFNIDVDNPVFLEAHKALYADFTINTGSFIHFNAKAPKPLTMRLNGIISIVSEEDGISLPGMAFQKFDFDGEKINVDSLSISFASPQKWIGGSAEGDEDDKTTAGFPVTFRDFHPLFNKDGDNWKLGLGFTLSLNLVGGDWGFGADANIEITSRLKSNFEPEAQFPAVKFNDIRIDVDVSIVHVSGALKFVKNDRTYGNGVRGCLTVEMNLPGLPIQGGLQGMFGVKNDGAGDYRYFYIDGRIQGLGLIIPQTTLAIDGFVGGLSYNMASFADLSERFGAEFVPCSFERLPPLRPVLGTIGVAFGVIFKEAGSQGYAFNGIMAFAADIDRSTGAPKRFQITGSINFLKSPESAPQDYMKINATLNLDYDFVENIFSGNFNVKLKVSANGSGLIGSQDADGSAGTMVMYVGHGSWMIWLGNPWGSAGYDNILTRNHVGAYAGVKISVPVIGELGSAGMYFCLGNYPISSLPPLPEAISSRIDEETRNRIQGTRPRQSAQTAGGVAFGAFFSAGASKTFGFGEAGKLVADLSVGAGFDLSLVKYVGDAVCDGTNTAFGINGYYARGRAYGFARAKVSYWFDNWDWNEREDEYRIFDEKVLITANFGGPNPTWLDGYVAISKGALAAVPNIGWAVWAGIEAGEALGLLTESDDVQFDFSVGRYCEPGGVVAENRPNPIIAFVLPEATSNNMDKRPLKTGDRIRVLLNKPLDEVWSVTVGGESVRRRWEFKSASLTNRRIEVPVSKWSIDSKELDFTLNSDTKLLDREVFTFTVTFGIEELVNGNWENKNTYSDGSSTIETRTETFRVVAPDYLVNSSDIETAYPAAGQKFYLQGNGLGHKGFLKLNHSMPEFADANKVRLFVKIFGDNQLLSEVPLVYKNYGFERGAAFEYALPKFSNDINVRVEFWAENKLLNARLAGGQTGITAAGMNAQVGQPSASNGTMLSAGFTGAATGADGRSETRTPPPASDPVSPFIRMYSIEFHTSRYNTFDEKISAGSMGGFRHWNFESYDMNAAIRTDEAWDDIEVGTGESSFFKVTSRMPTAWQQTLKPFIESRLAGMEGMNGTGVGIARRRLQDVLAKLNGESDVSVSIVKVEGSSIDLLYPFNQHLMDAAGLYPRDVTQPGPDVYHFKLTYEPPIIGTDGIVGRPNFITRSSSNTSHTTSVGGVTTYNTAQENSFTAPANPQFSNGLEKSVSIAYTGFEDTVARQQRAMEVFTAYLQSVSPAMPKVYSANLTIQRK